MIKILMTEHGKTASNGDEHDFFFSCVSHQLSLACAVSTPAKSRAGRAKGNITTTERRDIFIHLLCVVGILCAY